MLIYQNIFLFTKKNTKIIFLSFISVLFFVIFAPFSVTADDSVDFELRVSASCNYNNTCDPGEDIYGCLADCSASGPGGGSTTSGGTAPLVISNVAVSSVINSAIISWNTNRNASASLSWGITPEYELGSIGSLKFSNQHFIYLGNLSPNQKYYFQIKIEDLNRLVKTYNSSFITSSIISNISSPPSNLYLLDTQKGVRITWSNPKDLNFQNVRIMRSERTFPINPFIGDLIYEGRSETFLDTDVVVDHRYFYSVFSREGGIYSSPIIGNILITSDKDKPLDFSTGLDDDTSPPFPFEQYPNFDSSKEPTGEIDISLSDFLFEQDGRYLYFDDDSRMEVKRGLPISVIYQDENDFDNEKNIFLIIRGYKNTNDAYLFLRNEDGKKYELKINLSGDKMTTPFSIFVFDKDKKFIKDFTGHFVVKSIDINGEVIPLPWYFYIILLIILIFLLILISRKFTKNDDKR